jgi:signal transduction histidine kinase
VLISQLLHEIRNPIHNLAAALEDSPGALSESSEGGVITRNVDQLKRVVEQLSRWGAVYDLINPGEPVELASWLGAFIEDKVRPELNRLGAHYAQHADLLIVRMHPMLLEQVFASLMANACDELAKTSAPRSLTVTARQAAGGDGMVELEIANSGNLFPAEVLAAQGRTPVSSRGGLGLGLLLVRKLLEQVGGSLRLENRGRQAVVVLRVPGGAA